MPETPSAYPLSWPIGWPRTPRHQRRETRFSSSRSTVGYRSMEAIKLTDARDRLIKQLDLLRAGTPVLSTNLELRLDGLPRAGQPEPADPGAALYFRLKGKPIALACDRWKTVAGNIAAIAAHIEAMRGMDRWGVGSLEQMFTGYLQLPAPIAPDDWRTVLGDPQTRDQAEAAYRERMRTAHPDAGGSHAAAAALNGAIARAREAL